ncbi:MAG: hypothetical protein U0169_21275 [Polyangiaceae bacterium]
MSLRSPGVAAFGLVLGSSLLLGCPVPQSRQARAQEAARELNLNARFGRTELVMERVAPASRIQYAMKHRLWGNGIRVADLEMTSLALQKEDEVVVTILVSWFRPDEDVLHGTTLKQKWKDFRGDWMLVDEETMDGELGLLGEQVVREKAPPRRQAQFPTIRLGE